LQTTEERDVRDGPDGAASNARTHGSAQIRRGRPMEQTWFAFGCLLMVAGVAAGAFAAHGLKARLSADNLEIWQTAARYHIYHALALLAVAYAAHRWSNGLTTLAGWLFIAGIVLFSGSLYILSVSGIKWLGAVTPLGGLCFLAGWVSLGAAAWRG
jgi:uncharacterized membrane protein YgdD (TMEM256/DUF423 family)